VVASECLQDPDSSLVKESLQVINSEIQRRFRKKNMASEGKEGEYPPMRLEEFMDTLRSMREIIDDLYRRIHKSSDEEYLVKVEGGGEGGGPKEPSSPSSSSSSTNGASEHYSHKKSTKKSSHAHNFPLLKLDVKFELLIYDGELNVEKLDNWIKKIEVYCRVQKIVDDTAKIKLATLRLA
jgi:hypothetical protein